MKSDQLVAHDYSRPRVRDMAGTVVRVSPTPVCQANPMSRMTVPPNVIATLSVWGTVWLSSRMNVRAPFIIAAGVVAIIGKENISSDYNVRTNPFPGYIILISSANRE